MGEAVCVRVYGGSVLLSILSATLYYFPLDVARCSWVPYRLCIITIISLNFGSLITL